jgi:hypothetical protein
VPNEQHFPAWPLITAVISQSPRAGAYTARVEFPHAPVRILKRSELPPLRREVIAKVQQWTNDEWHKPVRLQVEDPDGRWVLGVPRDGPIVELDTIPPVEPTALRTVSPTSPLPAAAPSARRTPRPARSFTQRTARQRLSSRRDLRPRALAIGVLALVLAAGAYAILSSTSTPVHAQAVARTATPREAVRASPPATSTAPAVSTAPAAATTVTRRPRHHASTPQRHARQRQRQRQRPRAARRRAHRSHRRVVSHARPAVSAPTARSDTSSPPPPVTSTPTAPTATPALAPAAAPASHTRSGGGCAGTNCLPVPGNGPPPL